MNPDAAPFKPPDVQCFHVENGEVTRGGEKPRQAREVQWMPPGADAKGEEQALFGTEAEDHFHVPKRLQEKSQELVETVNDFHYAMMNDHERNEFYRASLAKVVTPETTVLEVGCGSGLLSIISASLGAKHVYAIEANKHLAQLARNIIAANGYSEKITVINKLSTEVEVEEIGDGMGADIMVSEILGTVTTTTENDPPPPSKCVLTLISNR